MSRQNEFDAFLAGFNESGEGFNGEYVAERYRGKNGVENPEFLARMQAAFDRWYDAKLKAMSDYLADDRNWP